MPDHTLETEPQLPDLVLRREDMAVLTEVRSHQVGGRPEELLGYLNWLDDTQEQPTATYPMSGQEATNARLALEAAAQGAMLIGRNTVRFEETVQKIAKGALQRNPLGQLSDNYIEMQPVEPSSADLMILTGIAKAGSAVKKIRRRTS